jgi:hypothetical protein
MEQTKINGYYQVPLLLLVLWSSPWCAGLSEEKSDRQFSTVHAVFATRNINGGKVIQPKDVEARVINKDDISNKFVSKEECNKTIVTNPRGPISDFYVSSIRDAVGYMCAGEDGIKKGQLIVHRQSMKWGLSGLDLK